MALSQIQLERLTAFTMDQPPAEGWKLITQGPAEYASRHIEVTSEFGWTLMLFSDGKAGWHAFCANESEKKFAGTWHECTEWLARQGRNAERVKHQVWEMAVFAGRRSWRFKETGQGARPFVRRLFEFPEVNGGEKVALFLALNDYRRAPFTGQVQMPFSAGPEESVTDELGPVTVWLEDWETTLAVPERLRECSDLDEAERVAERTDWKHVQRLMYLFELSPSLAPGPARQALARLFAPAD